MSNMIQHDQTSLMSEEVCTPGCLRKPSPARLSRRSLDRASTRDASELGSARESWPKSLPLNYLVN